MSILVSVLPWLQVVVSVLLIGAILLQRGDEGLGGVFGGTVSGVFYSKRGMEKWLFVSTIVLAVIFLVINILTLFF